MLARPHFARRAFSATRRRHYSEAVSPLPDYHSKVRAIPFAFSPEDAISHIGLSASVAGYVGGADKGPNVPATKVLASLLAKYLPMSGFKPLRPMRIQPVYFPTWFVSAEIGAMVWLSSGADTDGSHRETTTVQFEDLYLPGYSMDFGRMLIRNPPTHMELAQPFSPDLARQWGFNVMCLPYNILPFDNLDKARALSYSDAVVSENLRFNPQSLKMRLAAVYPVLLPVYLAQYISKEPWPPVTIILPAHSDPGIHYIHIPHTDTKDSLRLPFEELFASQDGYINVSDIDDDAEAELRAMVVNPAMGEALTSDLSAWLSDKFQRDVLASMAARRPVDMEDPRIREWKQSEVDPVYRWLRMGRIRAFMKSMFFKNIETEDMDKNQPTSPDQGPPRWTEEQLDPGVYSWLRIDQARSPAGKPIPKTEYLNTLFNSLHMNDSEWQALRATLTPEWWRKWEEGQKPQRSIQ